MPGLVHSVVTSDTFAKPVCRELFEAWCEDPRNGIIIADFAVAGTLAREVLDEPKEIMSHSGHKVSLGFKLSILTSVTFTMLSLLGCYIYTKQHCWGSAYCQESGLSQLQVSELDSVCNA